MCQFEGCFAAFKKFAYLVKHIKRQHQVDDLDIAGHWVQAAALHERRAGAHADQLMCPAEFAFAGIVYTGSGEVDELRFRCKVCDEVLAKRSCKKHMSSKHDFDENDVVKWLTQKDGELLHNKKGNDDYIASHLQLTIAVLQAESDAGDVDVAGGEVAAATDDKNDDSDGNRTPPPLMKATPKRLTTNQERIMASSAGSGPSTDPGGFSPLRRSLDELRDAIKEGGSSKKKKSKKYELEEPSPEVTITDEALVSVSSTVPCSNETNGDHHNSPLRILSAGGGSHHLISS